MKQTSEFASRFRGLRRIVLALSLMLAASSLAATSLVACKGGGSEEADEKKAAIEVFEGDKPSWPSELEGVSLGQTLDEWKAAGFEKERIKSKKFKGVTYYADTGFRGNVVDQVTVRFKADGNVKDELTKRWGEPQPLTDIMGSNDWAWVNPETGLRARITGDEQDKKNAWVYLERFAPMANVFTGDPGPLAFEKDAPLLGKTADELLQAYPGDYLVGEGAKPDQGHFELPPTEFDRSALRIHPYFGDDGKVGSYHFTLRVPDDKKAEAMATIAKKFGEPRVAKMLNDELKVFFVRDHKMRVRVDDAGKNTIEVKVERFLPIEELFTDKSRLSFEGDKSLLGSLTKAQWDEKYASQNSWLQLPPTDYESSGTMISPHFEGDLLKSYSFSVDGSFVPGTKEEIFERFKKALGEPTESKQPYSDKSQFTFATTPPVVLEESYSGEGWMVRVGP